MADKIESPIPRRLKEARLKTELSQKALGIAIGIDQFSASSRMNHYEQGLHSPDFSLLSRVSELLKIPTSYFYTIDDELAELILDFNKLNKKQKKELKSFMKGICG